MERRLHASQPQPRFWRISLEGLELVIRSGAIGTPGSVNKIPCKSPEAAQKTFDSLVAQRLKDGFLDEAAAEVKTLSPEAEKELLRDDPERWLVFADSLLESGDPVRGELIGLQVKAAKRVRGSIGQAKEFIREHYDELVGPGIASFHTQVTVDWSFGYARTARIWSGPYTAPIGDVVEAVLNSPACRFLQRLEFGSPGTQGKYDPALKVLASLEWPAHLNHLVLGEFDVAQSFKTENAWPRIDSLFALQPVASRIETLEVRAALNTLGKGLTFPSLKRSSRGASTRACSPICRAGTRRCCASCRSRSKRSSASRSTPGPRRFAASSRTPASPGSSCGAFVKGSGCSRCSKSPLESCNTSS